MVSPTKKGGMEKRVKENCSFWTVEQSAKKRHVTEIYHFFGTGEQPSKKRRVTNIDKSSGTGEQPSKRRVTEICCLSDSCIKVESPTKNNEETPIKTKRIKEAMKRSHDSTSNSSEESPEMPRRTKYRASDIPTGYAECSSKSNKRAHIDNSREERNSKRSYSLCSARPARHSSEDLRLMLQRKTIRNSDVFVSNSKNIPKDSGLRRKRSFTENIADFRNKQKFWKDKDHSSSEENSTFSNKDSSASPWIADFLSRSLYNASSPHQSARKSLSGACFTDISSKRPLLGSYQLLGDSLFVRFAEQILQERAVIGENGKFSNGYCVGGQTIQELTERLDHPNSFLHPNVIVLIGTNDFLKNTSPASKKEALKSLIKVLHRKTKKIIFLTLPPIPRLKTEPFYWECWEAYNRWLTAQSNGSTIKVIDIAPLFLLKARKPDMEAFEQYMGYGRNKREDNVHLNKLGLLRLNDELQKHINSPEASLEELKKESSSDSEYSSDSSTESQDQTDHKTVGSEETTEKFKSTCGAALNNQKWDELSVFGEHVASELRMIKNKEKRERVKKKIIKELSAGKMDFLSTNNMDRKKYLSDISHD